MSNFFKLKSGECSTHTRESGLVLNRCPKRRLSRGVAHTSILLGKVSERVPLKQRELRRGEEWTRKGEDITQRGKRRHVLSSPRYTRNIQQELRERFTVWENFPGAVHLTWIAVIMWV